MKRSIKLQNDLIPKRNCPDSEEKFDYFNGHFCKNFDDSLFEKLELRQLEKKEPLNVEAFKNFNAMAIWRGNPAISFKEPENFDFSQFDISSKLLKNLNKKISSAFEKEIYQIIGRYMDLCLISKQDPTTLICLHSLNHVMRTRNLVINNKQILENALKDGSTNEEIIENCRDQGLARPKILILCPVRKNAYAIVKRMIELVFGKSEKPFVSNLAKFEKEFTDKENAIHEKRKVSSEFRELMSGNVDDCFRLGIGLAKKCLKLYTPFSDSDILVCSPLGLRMIIGDENEEKRDLDFLASIEILIIDKAHLLYMQNWEHLIGIFQSVNLVPSKINADISRVRQWSLKELSKYYRQTLIFSEINFVEMHALFSQFCQNFEGQISMAELPKSLIKRIEVPVVQGFFRFDMENLSKQSDQRFEFFIREILPKCEPQTFIFIPSYFDFVRLRNYLKKEDESFVQVHEYAEKGKVAKARNMFVLRQRKLMLMTERFHFFYRYNIKGIHSVIFYQLPFNPQFYHELLNLATPKEDTTFIQSKVLYNKFDVVRLQNIFGHSKSRDLINSPQKVHSMIAE